MSSEKSLVSEIIIRKIPQIVGMYIASVWLAVEISDWMSGKFHLPGQFSTYVFVSMMVFLPSAILMAWGHGRKGKDNWSNLEKLFIPVNLLVVVFAVMFLIKPTAIDASFHAIVSADNSGLEMIDKMSVVDVETGRKITYEVAKPALHQSVVAYFLNNESQDDSLDWLSYGSSWLIAQDLKRTPFISVITAFDTSKLLNQLKVKGFDNATAVPQSLALQVANNLAAKWFIQGSFAKIKNQIEFTAHLYDVKTGKEIKTIKAINADWLIALDTISAGISEVILNTANVSKSLIPQLAIAEHTSKNIQAIQHLISAMRSVTFKNDFNEGLAEITKALQIDSSFADANVLAMSYYAATGDFNKAISQASTALELDYKLYQETVFLVKANLYGLSGKKVKAIKVLENWTKIYPQSIEALSILGRNYMVAGNHQQQAIEIYKKIVDIEGTSSKALINLGDIYRLQNNKEKALQVLGQYKDAHPTKGEAYFGLADTYKQFGLFDKAREMYEEASLFDNKDYKAEIGLADLVALDGNYQSAVKQLEAILAKSKTDSQKLNILLHIQLILSQTGQMHKALIINKKLEQYGNKVLPPLSAAFQIFGSKIAYLALLGQFDLAREENDKLIKNLKPPFDQLSSFFMKSIYEYQQDVENYKLALSDVEKFINSLSLATLTPDVIRSKGKIAYWEKDYQTALKLYDHALNETKQSIVTLQTLLQVDDLIFEKAQALFALGQAESALQQLDFIISHSPLNARVYRLKAQIYHQLGEHDKVQQALAQAHKIWQFADEDYLEYKDLLAFEKTLVSE
jgi:tetratricopeptide (TPR) repeat protein